MRIELDYPVNNAKLKQILKDYFSSTETEKPLVIFSKPFSGRTSTIEQVMNELGIGRSDCLNVSIRHCPLLHSELLTEDDGTVMPFDSWIELSLEKKRIQGTYKYTIIEIEPNEFLTIDFFTLWGDNFFGYKGFGEGYLKALTSEKYQLIAYYPKVKEWMEWAKTNNYNQKTIDFATENPEFYDLISYRVFVAFEDEIRGPQYYRRKVDGFNIDYYISNIGGLIPGNLCNLLRKACIQFLTKNEIPYVVSSIKPLKKYY